MIVGLILVAPFWAGIYALWGWRGVAVAVLVGLAGEILILLGDRAESRRQRAIALRRLEQPR